MPFLSLIDRDSAMQVGAEKACGDRSSVSEERGASFDSAKKFAPRAKRYCRRTVRTVMSSSCPKDFAASAM